MSEFTLAPAIRGTTMKLTAGTAIPVLLGLLLTSCHETAVVSTYDATVRLSPGKETGPVERTLAVTMRRGPDVMWLQCTCDGALLFPFAKGTFADKTTGFGEVLPIHVADGTWILDCKYSTPGSRGFRHLVGEGRIGSKVVEGRWRALRSPEFAPEELEYEASFTATYKSSERVRVFD